MKVQYTRAHVGGCMSGIGEDVTVVDLPDKDASGNATAVPDGAILMDAKTPVSDWAWDQSTQFYPATRTATPPAPAHAMTPTPPAPDQEGVSTP